jgi:hypothetical protein
VTEADRYEAARLAGYLSFLNDQFIGPLSKAIEAVEDDLATLGHPTMAPPGLEWVVTQGIRGVRFVRLTMGGVTVEAKVKRQGELVRLLVARLERLQARLVAYQAKYDAAKAEYDAHRARVTEAPT